MISLKLNARFALLTDCFVPHRRRNAAPQPKSDFAHLENWMIILPRTLTVNFEWTLSRLSEIVISKYRSRITLRDYGTEKTAFEGSTCLDPRETMNLSFSPSDKTMTPSNPLIWMPNPQHLKCLLQTCLHATWTGVEPSTSRAELLNYDQTQY